MGKKLIIPDVNYLPYALNTDALPLADYAVRGYYDSTTNKIIDTPADNGYQVAVLPIPGGVTSVRIQGLTATQAARNLRFCSNAPSYSVAGVVVQSVSVSGMTDTGEITVPSGALYLVLSIASTYDGYNDMTTAFASL